MSDSESLEAYYNERIYQGEPNRRPFEQLTDDEKIVLFVSHGYTVWQQDQKLNEALEVLSDDFASKASGWLDDDWMLLVFVFLVAIGFVLLGLTAAFN